MNPKIFTTTGAKKSKTLFQGKDKAQAHYCVMVVVEHFSWHETNKQVLKSKEK
jgi:hypothetical protein